MKKILYCLIAVVLLISLGLSACTASTPEQEGWPSEIVIGAAGGGGHPIFAMSGGIALMLEEHLGVKASLTETGGYDASALLKNGDVHIVWPTSSSAKDILCGIGPAEFHGPVPARAWLQALIIEVNTITMDSSGIKSFSDLEGKIVGVPKGDPSIIEYYQAIAKIYGLDFGKIRLVEFGFFGEAYDGIKVGKFDVINAPGMHPNPSDMELFIKHPGRILHIDDAHLAQLRQEIPYLTYQIIPGGTYKGMDEDTQTPGVAIFSVTHRDLPESFIYEMTKMVWEHFDQFSKFHPQAASMSPEAVSKVVPMMPYHDGAIKYYREIGVWGKELDKIQADLIATLPAEVQ